MALTRSVGYELLITQNQRVIEFNESLYDQQIK